MLELIKLAMQLITPLLGVWLGHCLAIRSERIKIEYMQRNKEKKAFDAIFYPLHYSASFLVNSFDTIKEADSDIAHDSQFIGFRSEAFNKLLNRYFRSFETSLNDFIARNGFALCPPTKHTRKFINKISKIKAILDLFDDSALNEINPDFPIFTHVRELSKIIIDLSYDANKYYQMRSGGIISLISSKRKDND